MMPITRSGKLGVLAHGDPCEKDAEYGCQHERHIVQAEQEASSTANRQIAAIRAKAEALAPRHFDLHGDEEWTAVPDRLLDDLRAILGEPKAIGEKK